MSSQTASAMFPPEVLRLLNIKSDPFASDCQQWIIDHWVKQAGNYEAQDATCLFVSGFMHPRSRLRSQRLGAAVDSLGFAMPAGSFVDYKSMLRFGNGIKLLLHSLAPPETWQIRESVFKRTPVGKTVITEEQKGELAQLGFDDKLVDRIIAKAGPELAYMAAEYGYWLPQNPANCQRFTDAMYLLTMGCSDQNCPLTRDQIVPVFQRYDFGWPMDQLRTRQDLADFGLGVAQIFRYNPNGC